jgi:hypothetical protein
MNSRYIGVAAIALGTLLAGCNGSTNNIPRGPGTVGGKQAYVQIELLSRPAVKEVFEKFVDHQVTNATEPYNDPTLQGEIQALEDALRPPNTNVGSDYGKALASVLYPNVYIVDLSQTGPASYLGVETGGATGGKFGGRAVTDDVVDISLGALFGNTLAKLGVQPEDNEENNCLTTDNVSIASSQKPTSSFPYLHPPH